jgi:hypothetical protein
MSKHITHPNGPSDPIRPISVCWRRPVLPERGPTDNAVESPISRRLLDDLRLVPGERLLVANVRDVQFIGVAADAVGPHGRVTCIESEAERARRLRRYFARQPIISVLPAIPARPTGRYDAIGVVLRGRTVPDQSALAAFGGHLADGGRLAVIAMESSASRIAASGWHRNAGLRRAS